MSTLSWHIEQRKIYDLKVWEENPRFMSDKDRADLDLSLKRFDYVEVVIINTDNRIIGGHQRIDRLLAAGKGEDIIDVRVPNRKLNNKEFKELAVRLNKNRGQWDDDKLEALFNTEELKNWGFDEMELEKIFHIKTDTDVIVQSLQEKFIIPPFSIFDSRQGYWQDRKKLWNSLFDSQETREEVELIAKSGQSPAIYHLRNKMRTRLKRDPEWDEILEEAKKRGLHTYSGASTFDPVLTEICYKWFCPQDATILDPFAGGSVRGIVAGILGLNYTGIDLREEQVSANFKQWLRLNNRNSAGVNWLVGDSNEALKYVDGEHDFIFSCPPYHDLEQYSDDPADLSNMSYSDFLTVYRSIIEKSVARLKENRFACFVVGEIRDEKGFYRDFVGDTVQAFKDAGMEYYNEIILINVAGSLPVRIGRQFGGYRKVGKIHQNVLVFYKGDPKKIKTEFPEINAEKYLQELNYQPNITLSVVDD